MGGLATYKKYGRDHYVAMAKKRWKREKRKKKK